jgi:Cys-rich repeat protein
LKSTKSMGLVLLALVGCTTQTGPTLARPNTQHLKTQAQGLGGTGLAATAQFDAPVIDGNSQAPVTPGTGSFTVAPSTSGGPASLGVIDTSSSPSTNYVIIGDLSGTGTFFAVLTDGAFTVGTLAIDNQHSFAGVFDAVTGDPRYLASSGTVTFTTAGGLGGRWVGSFTGTVDEVAPQCQTSADCATGEVCLGGTCTRTSPPPPQCSASVPCAAGLVCQAGVCVSAPPPPPACQVDADCATGQQCLRGVCVMAQPPPPGMCSGAQGQGSVSGQVTATASCAALTAGTVQLTQGMAVIDDQLRLVVFDPALGAGGAYLTLSVCPGATGTLTLGNGLVEASHLSEVTTPDLHLYAERRASAASLTVTRVAPLAGSFTMTLRAGGSVSGSFTMQ